MLWVLDLDMSSKAHKIMDAFEEDFEIDTWPYKGR